MSSFYGGKQGRTYHIVARFDSVANMVTAFANGGAYTLVNYGLYVLIDTILNRNAKSDHLNGLIYRRGFDYQDDPSSHIKPDITSSDYYENGNFLKDKWQSDWTAWVSQPGAGAIYVGQIVGPQGDTPEIELIQWEDLPLETRTNNAIIPISTTSGNDLTTIKDSDDNDVYNGDTIKVASVNVTDLNGNITGAQLAFDIPNLVMEAGSIDNDPYKTPGVSQDSETENHPFWYKWNFVVPGGKKGTSIEDFKIETGSETEAEYFKTLDRAQDINKVYYIYDLVNNSYNIFEFPQPSGEELEEQPQLLVDFTKLYEKILPGDSYITYSLRDYEERAEGVITEHLGRWPYRVIQNISTESKNRDQLTWELYINTIQDSQTVNEELIITYRTHIGDSIPIQIHSIVEYTEKITKYILTQDTSPVEDKTYYQRIEEDDEEIYIIISSVLITNPSEAGLYLQIELDGLTTRTDVYSHDDARELYCVCIQEGLIDPLVDFLKYIFEENLIVPLGNEYQVGGSKWRIMKVPETAPAHTLIVDYMAGEDDRIPNLRNLDFLTVDVNGDLYATYSDSVEPYYLSNIGGIDSVVLNDNGLVITYKQKDLNGNSITRSFPIAQIKSINFLDDEGNEDSTLRIRYKNSNLSTDLFSVPRIDDIIFNNNDYTKTQDFLIKYKGDLEYSSISQPVNTVLAIDKVGDSVIMLYSDPAVRAAIPENNKYIKNWTDPLTEIVYLNLSWYKFGPWEAQYHVAGEYTYSDLLGDSTAEDYSIDLSEGFENAGFPERAGWLVTVSEEIEVLGETLTVKHIYAYDYNDTSENGKHIINGTNTHWYEVMSLDAASVDPGSVVIVDDDEPQGDYRNGTIWYPISYGHDDY